MFNCYTYINVSTFCFIVSIINMNFPFEKLLVMFGIQFQIFPVPQNYLYMRVIIRPISTNNLTNWKKNLGSKFHATQLCIINHHVLKKEKRDKGEKHAIIQKIPRKLAATRDTLQTVRFRRVMLSFLPKALDTLRIMSTSKVLIGNTWICNRIISYVTSWHLFHCKSVIVTENGALELCCGLADFLIIGTGLTWDIGLLLLLFLARCLRFSFTSYHERFINFNLTDI